MIFIVVAVSIDNNNEQLYIQKILCAVEWLFSWVFLY